MIYLFRGQIDRTDSSVGFVFSRRDCSPRACSFFFFFWCYGVEGDVGKQVHFIYISFAAAAEQIKKLTR